VTKPTTIVLEPAVLRFEGDGFVVGGLRWLPQRRIALRDVYGIERAGAHLWIGVGLVPVVLGGRAATAEALARAEAELRARIGLLPGGRARLARIDARRSRRPHLPWLTATLALALAGLGLAAQAPLRLASDLVWLVVLGLLAEPWLGAVRALASGAAAAGTAALLAPAGALVSLAPLAVALGWAGTLSVLRLSREPLLGVRLRSALDAGAPLGLALVLHALGFGAAPLALLAAALAGALVAPLVLRGRP
jgi:hypothetical protein